MPNYVRWREEHATYFFTVATYRRRPLFADEPARRLLRRAFVEVRRQRPFHMFAVVLLPDDLHCIWTLPPEDDDFPSRWANVKRRFTQAYLKSGGTSLPVSADLAKHHQRGVWQPRYWEHRIRDEAELYAYRDYIHLNPVKHGLATDPLGWQWSSVHRHLRLGWLAPDWTAWTPIDISALGEPSEVKRR